MMARRRQIEGDLLGCENELAALTVQPAWRCVHQRDVTSRGTLVVFCIPISVEELDLRVSVLLPDEEVSSREDARRMLVEHFNEIAVVLEKLLPDKRTASEDVVIVHETLQTLRTSGVGRNAISVEQVIPINAGPPPEVGRCTVIDYDIH